jgi:hypothetical protein
MKIKIILALFTVQILCLIVPHAVFCQTETLDMVTYTPPKGWTKTPKEDGVIFSDSNKTANVFCVMRVYANTASSGDAKKDFANDWETFVVTPYKADEKPKTETQNGDGWTITTAVALIEPEGVKSLAMLTNFSGFGKTTSILVLSNSETYTKPVSDFLESVKLDKSPLAVKTPNTTTTPTAPTSLVADSYSPTALVGKWGNGTAGDTVSGGYITYGSNASQKYYQFNADGTYSFIFSGYSGLAGQSGTFQITTQESGVYTLNGDSMTITPKKSQTKSNSEGLKNNSLEVVNYRWTIHYFEGIKEYDLIMHPDHKTKRDGEFDYAAAFPNSYIYSKAK